VTSSNSPDRSSLGVSEQSEALSGAIVVDKPAGWTSHDVVNKVRRLAGIRKVGHLGTLDPGATGVLPLLIGRATRLSQFFGRAEKHYEGVISFGYSTDTYDAAGTPTSQPVPFTLDPAALETALDTFRGPLRQIPPPVSAKKIGGVRAYKLARQNQTFELTAADVTVFAIEVRFVEGNEAGLHIHCSSGTYVRSIAHDLGRWFGCGAFLKSLRRTASGEFTLKSAATLEQLGSLAENGRFQESVIPAGELLTELPVEYVDQATAAFIRQGRDFRVSPFGPSRDARRVKAIGPDGDLLAVGEAILPNLYHPILVL